MALHLSKLRHVRTLTYYGAGEFGKLAKLWLFTKAIPIYRRVMMPPLIGEKTGVPWILGSTLLVIIRSSSVKFCARWNISGSPRPVLAYRSSLRQSFLT